MRFAFLWLTACFSIALTACSTPDRASAPANPERGFPAPPTLDADAQVLRSGLNIPPAETFLLGGGQPGSFAFTAYNFGDTDVLIGSEPSDGRPAVTIGPNATHTRYFDPGTMATLSNLSSSKTATLKVTISSEGRQNLGMRYRPNE